MQHLEIFGVWYSSEVQAMKDCYLANGVTYTPTWRIWGLDSVVIGSTPIISHKKGQKGSHNPILRGLINHAYRPRIRPGMILQVHPAHARGSTDKIETS